MPTETSCLCVMAQLGEQMEAQAGLDSPSTTAPLCSVTLGHERLDQSTDLSFLVKPTE